MIKKILTLVVLFSSCVISAQAYKGKGDVKFQVGANFQEGGTGIVASTDFGIGENMSYGFSASYLLGVQSILDAKPEFKDRADVKVRFNANLGNVLNIDEKFDVYPGLDLGLKNFGGHLGARYFFTDGFGLYTELGVPIAKYDNHITGFDHLNNQFHVNFGMSFNL